MEDNKTFCIGYWALSDNVKRDLAHYTKLLPLTMSLLADRQVLFFYHDHSVLERASNLAREHCIVLHPCRIALEALPNRESALNVLHATEAFGQEHSEPPAVRTKEKGVEHYWRDYRQSGREVYHSMLSIWLSKIPLITRAIEENPFQSEYFAWVDASLARFNSKRDFFEVGRVVDCDNRISFFRGKLTKNGSRLMLNASYLSPPYSPNGHFNR